MGSHGPCLVAVSTESSSCNCALVLSYGHEEMSRHAFTIVLKLVSDVSLFKLTM